MGTVPFPDITFNKHGGNAKSKKANKRAHPHKATMRERIRVFVVAAGYQGTTLKQIAECFGVEKNAISGRITELKIAKENPIFDSGREIDGFTVLVGRKEWVNGSAEASK